MAGKVIDFRNISEEMKLDDQSIKKKVKDRRRRQVLVGGIIAVIVVLIIIIISVITDNITYTSYVVNNSVNRDDTESADYMVYGSGYLRYSNDGIAYHNKKGDVIWNHTYTMNSPQVKIKGKAIAVADINGTKVYIYNESGEAGSIDTSMTISQHEVAEQGVVAVVLEDTNANYINLYDTSGKKIYSVKTSLSGDGYPVDISISSDATKLVASYLYVSGETMKTNVVFYNFSEVGKNETERIVGGFNHYDDTLVGDVRFVKDDKVLAVGENVISIYSIKEYPKLLEEISIDKKIKRVFYSDAYIGLIMDNAENGDAYEAVVYDLSGKKQGSFSFNAEYTDIAFDGKTIVMSSASVMSIVNFKGKILGSIEMKLPIRRILVGGKKGNYILVNSKYVQSIRLQ